MLPIRRTCHFLLDKQKGWKALQIRYRIRYGGGYITSVYVGYRVDPDKWSPEAERCLKNTTHGDRRTPAAMINRALQYTEEAIDSAFSYFEEIEYLPTPEELKEKYNEYLGETLGTSKQAPAKVAPEDKRKVVSLIDLFIEAESVRRSWSERHKANIRTARMHLADYSQSATLEDISEKWVAGFITHLTAKRGLLNSSVDKTLRILKSALYWAQGQGLYEKDYRRFFEVRLKGIDSNRAEVYLTWEELSRLASVELRLHSERVARDLFCFLCFTGLRYSDLKKLTHDNITPTSIRYYAQKTDQLIEVDINDHARAILDKYKGEETPLPPMAEQRLNRTLKSVCEQAGINAPVTRLRYSGRQRIEETLPKYEVITSHIGRHTFVVQALTLGIPSEVIRKYTGHKTEKTMRPYVAIADTLKAQEMEKFNRPLLSSQRTLSGRKRESSNER
jgi:site-specific recombinase, phage integrase family|nr:MAG TPA: Integrase [Caudoviricetes sp.]